MKKRNIILVILLIIFLCLVVVLSIIAQYNYNKLNEQMDEYYHIANMYYEKEEYGMAMRYYMTIYRSACGTKYPSLRDKLDVCLDEIAPIREEITNDQ